MATQTTNYEFVKPVGTENADVVIFDNNMDSLDSEMNKVSKAMTIVEQGDTATQNIQKGAFVFWKNTLYRATVAIATGDTFGDENLSRVTAGAMNEPMFPQVLSAHWTYTVNASSYTTGNLKPVIDAYLPAGRTCLGIVGFNSGHSSVCFYRLMYENTDNSIGIKNLSDSKISNKTAIIYFLCA